MVLETLTVGGTTTEAVLSTLAGVFFTSVYRFCHCDSVSTVQDTVMKLYGSVVEIKMKARFEDGCGVVGTSVL